MRESSIRVEYTDPISHHSEEQDSSATVSVDGSRGWPNHAAMPNVHGKSRSSLFGGNRSRSGPLDSQFGR